MWPKTSFLLRGISCVSWRARWRRKNRAGSASARNDEPAGSHPEAGNNAKQGPQGQQKSRAVRAQQIVDIPTKPGTERSSESRADADQPEDRTKRRTGEEVGRNGTENWPTRAIAQTEEEGVEIEGPGDRVAGNQYQHENTNLGADDAERHTA